MPKPNNEALLKEIRDNFDYCVNEWREIRKEAADDMRLLAGDPWDPQERAARSVKGQERPCISLDLCNQYVNQVVNDVRQNPRGVTVVPTGEGANDKTAELRQGRIREIEYRSNAMTAYTTAFESAVSRSYGYFRIDKKYESPTSFFQELSVGRIPNPDTIYLDPDAREADFSDMGYAFELESIRRKDFAKLYPKAETINFSAEQAQEYSQWVQEDHIQIAGYWRVEITKRNLLSLNVNGKAIPFFEKGARTKQIDVLPESAEIVRRGDDEGQGDEAQGDFVQLETGIVYDILEERETEERRVFRYKTNGIEILAKEEWDGKWIPIIPVWGKELFLSKSAGSGAKRIIMSLVRLSRNPQQLFNWLWSNQMEEGGMTPKTPFIGYKGQFDNCNGWDTVHRVPQAFLEVNAVINAASGQVLEKPTRQPFIPNFAAYAIPIQAAERAVQSSMGMYNSSIGRHDTAAKSGVAVKQLDSQANQGSFHYPDNLNRALEHGGRVMNDLLDAIHQDEDGQTLPRTAGFRGPDEKYSAKKLGRGVMERGQLVDNELGTADDHGVTVKAGPSFDSQREAADAFVDLIIQELPQMPLDPKVKAKIIASGIRLKDIGPLGESMADLIDPPAEAGQQPLPPQAQQAIEQLKQQAMALNAHAQMVEQELAKLQQEKQAKIVENEYRLKIAELEGQVKLAMQNKDLANKLAIAEVTTKAQEAQTRAEMEQEQWKTLHGTAHDVATQVVNQTHERDMAAQQQTAAAEQMNQAEPQPPAADQAVTETPQQ